MVRSLSIAVVAAVLALGGPALAGASAEARPWKPVSAEAKRLGAEGLSAYDRGEYDLAIAKFDASYKVEPCNVSLWNMARAYHAKREFRRAVTFYGMILEDGALGDTERGAVQRRLDIANSFESALNHTRAGQRAEARDEYKRVLAIRDLDEEDREFAVDQLSRLGVSDSRTPAEPSPASAPGPVTAAPARVDESGIPAERVVDRPAPPPLAPAPRWYEDTLGWALVGGGAVSVAVGSGFLVHAGGLRDSVAREPNQAEQRRLYDAANTADGIGITGLVVGVGAIAAGAVTLALVPDSPVSLTVHGSGEAASVAVWGRF